MTEKSREYHRAVDYLCSLIESGEITEGQKLPSERSIAETLSISRNSIREALRSLENMGVVESRVGSGSYLSCNASETISETIEMMLLIKRTNRSEVCSFRRNMEKAVCREIIDSGSFSRWEPKISAVLHKSDNAAGNCELVLLDEEFHFLLVKATENSLWITILDAVAKIYRRWINKALSNAAEDVKGQLKNAHRLIVKAIGEGDFSACCRAIDYHYDIADRELSKLEMERRIK